jgi:hypothetical protein
MGVDFFLLPIILLFFYIIPIGLFFLKSIKKRIRHIILLIPIVVTILFTSVAIIETKKTNDLYKKYPQANKLTFMDKPENVRDSILALQDLMEKLPKRWDNNGVSYEIEKFRDRHNQLTLNRYRLGKFDDLISDSVFRYLRIPESVKTDWIKYVGNDIIPFDTLTRSETMRFISLTNYLDLNKLNGAFLHDGKIGLTYNDSLRIWVGTGFRTVIIDTSGYYDYLDTK